MKIPFVDLYAQYLTIKPQIDAAIGDVIANSAYIRSGHVDAFEKAWATTSQTKHCVSCANGTDALYITMRGLGLKPGDEVITTAHSWISTTETITQAGGRVVFCDTDNETFTIDPAQIAAKITPRTVGIIPVHLYGQSCDMAAIMAIAKQHSLWVIEDCAQSHLARFDNQQVGTFGNAATFSFYPGKNLGAYGDAGALVTNDDKLAEWSAIYARHGGKGEHLMEGINSRLDGIQAAILSVKLPHLNAWTAARRKVAASYDRLLAGVGDIVTPKIAPRRDHVFHLYVIRTNHRDALKKHLAEAGIATMLNYPKALPFYPAYSYLKHTPADFPVAHANQSRILSLPIFPEMTDEMIGYVASQIKGFFAKGN
ncbi:MAG: DegT/DnrJ/EryC1/StrS family aminotransferase protein [Verrucomicrobia bacterium]|nr:DegT/DnrJ/EryC1/StrS family aminotransferase protein [Verrucomicrobiota bacterium]